MICKTDPEDEMKSTDTLSLNKPKWLIQMQLSE